MTKQSLQKFRMRARRKALRRARARRARRRESAAALRKRESGFLAGIFHAGTHLAAPRFGSLKSPFNPSEKKAWLYTCISSFQMCPERNCLNIQKIVGSARRTGTETVPNQGSRALLSNHIASRSYRWFVPGFFFL